MKDHNSIGTLEEQLAVARSYGGPAEDATPAAILKAVLESTAQVKELRKEVAELRIALFAQPDPATARQKEILALHGLPTGISRTQAGELLKRTKPKARVK